MSLINIVSAPTHRPAADADFPEAYIPLGAKRDMYDRICDFATPGSPIIRMWISPLVVVPSSISLCVPPNSCNATACLTSSNPKIDGAMDLTRLLKNSGSLAISRILSSSSSVISISSYSSWENSTEIISMYVSKTVDLSRSLFSTGLMIPFNVTLLPGVTLPEISSSM